MIDIQNKVFNDISAAIKLQYNNASCYGEYVATPSSFPCVTLVEADNYIDERQMDSSAMENYADLMYECNIYSNLATGKKAQAIDIATIVDECMQSMGFRRTMKSQIPNEDTTIYRLIMRYTGRVSQGVVKTTESATTTTYTIYKK